MPIILHITYICKSFLEKAHKENEGFFFQTGSGNKLQKVYYLPVVGAWL